MSERHIDRRIMGRVAFNFAVGETQRAVSVRVRLHAFHLAHSFNQQGTPASYSGVEDLRSRPALLQESSNLGGEVEQRLMQLAELAGRKIEKIRDRLGGRESLAVDNGSRVILS